MTKRVDKGMIATWAQRWAKREFVLGEASPFGNTEEGAEDYRGLSCRNQRIAGLSIRHADFTSADLDNLRLEKCLFQRCIFDRAVLTQLVTRASKFEECLFRRADLRLARIGYGGTDFDRCTFDGVRLARAGFLNAIFTKVDFKAKDWSHTNFGASGFWDCSFKGVLKDVTFRGDYLYESQREISGPPKRAGLHNVTFADAELHWVGFYNGCSLQNITLPSDGSAFLCEVKDLVKMYSKVDRRSKRHEVLIKYLGIIRPNSIQQPQKIISKNDLITVGGLETGSKLYAFLKSILG